MAEDPVAHVLAQIQPEPALRSAPVARRPRIGERPTDADLAQRVTDWLAGMTDRYCIRAFEALSVPEAFAL